MTTEVLCPVGEVIVVRFSTVIGNVSVYERACK